LRDEHPLGQGHLPCRLKLGLHHKKHFRKLIIMNKEQKILRLQTQLKEWTARLNKSRKPSLIGIRALHVNHIQKELDALK
jgi:hypothetical protein